MTDHTFDAQEQSQQQKQPLPGRETLSGYLTTHVATCFAAYSHVVTWMTEQGASLNALDTLLENQWRDLPPDSPEANEYRQVSTLLDIYRQGISLPDQCVTRRLLPCPSQSICRGKTTEHFMIGDFYECQECGCRQHFQKSGQLTSRSTDLEEGWEE